MTSRTTKYLSRKKASPDQFKWSSAFKGAMLFDRECAMVCIDTYYSFFGFHFNVFSIVLATGHLDVMPYYLLVAPIPSDFC